MNLSILLPNKAVSKRTITIMIVSQVIFVLFVWSIWPSTIIPKPIEILDSFSNLWENGFAGEMMTSFALCLQALLLTTVISLAISYLTVIPFFRPLGALITKGRFLGLTGFVFIFALLASGGHDLKLMMLTFGMTVFFVTSMIAVIQQIPKSEFDDARTLRMSEWRTVLEVVILARVHDAIEIARQNFAMGWMMITMVEGVSRTEGGVGTLLINSNKMFQLGEIYAIQISIMIVGLLADYCIGLIDQMVCPYAFLNLERK
jgi:NitT/TauT family transport system permease protein